MHYRKTKSQTEVSGSYKELYTDDGGYKFGSDKAQRINRLPSFPKRPSPPKYTSKSTYSQSLNNQHVRVRNIYFFNFKLEITDMYFVG